MPLIRGSTVQVTGWGRVTTVGQRARRGGGDEEGRLPMCSVTGRRGRQASDGAYFLGHLPPSNTPNSYFGDFTPRPIQRARDGKEIELAGLVRGPGPLTTSIFFIPDATRSPE